MGINPKSALVSAKGGELDYVGADGEILFSVAVPAGRVDARMYTELAPEGVEVQVAMGDLVEIPPRAYAVKAKGNRYESGANPDYQPERLSDGERMIRQQLALLTARVNETRAIALQKAAARVERVPEAPAPAAQEPSSDVIETVEPPAAEEAAAE